MLIADVHDRHVSSLMIVDLEESDRFLGSRSLDRSCLRSNWIAQWDVFAELERGNWKFLIFWCELIVNGKILFNNQIIKCSGEHITEIGYCILSKYIDENQRILYLPLK